VNINFDAFWQYLNKWSVARMLVLLLVLGSLISKMFEKIVDSKMFFTLIIIAILLEVFELAHNKLVQTPPEKENLPLPKEPCWFSKAILSLIMLATVSGILWFSWCYFGFLLSAKFGLQ
jgi:hypothetical protein